MKSYYYLHTNGDLIFKPERVVKSEPGYFDSPFVRRVWLLDTEDRATCWIMLIEALSLGANAVRIKELQDLWNMTNEDAQIFAQRVGLVLKIDGDQWCAYYDDFIDLQSSPAGFGNDCLHAMADLIKLHDGEVFNSRFECD